MLVVIFDKYGEQNYKKCIFLAIQIYLVWPSKIWTGWLYIVTLQFNIRLDNISKQSSIRMYCYNGVLLWRFSQCLLMAVVIPCNWLLSSIWLGYSLQCAVLSPMYTVCTLASDYSLHCIVLGIIYSVQCHIHQVQTTLYTVHNCICTAHHNCRAAADIAVVQFELDVQSQLFQSLFSYYGHCNLQTESAWGQFI